MLVKGGLRGLAQKKLRKRLPAIHYLCRAGFSGCGKAVNESVSIELILVNKRPAPVAVLEYTLTVNIDGDVLVGHSVAAGVFMVESTGQRLTDLEAAKYSVLSQGEPVPNS